MAKQLTFTHEGTDYTLEFNRESVKLMESRGFVADDLVKRPMTIIPELFAGAFLAHHEFVKRKTIDDMFNLLSDKQQLLEALAEMYNDPVLSLLKDSEQKEGNVKWERGW